ncbi:zinc finger, CCHC-type containing protein [Tanacetum coccineum]
MHFLLTTLKVVYVLTTPIPELMEDDIVKAIRRKAKWENDDYICRGDILNGMFDSLFDVYHNVESAKELWDSLESKYMTEDASSKKFLIGHFKRDCRSGNKKNANAGDSKKGYKDQSQDQCQNLVPVWNRFIKCSVSLISEALYVHVDAIAWWIDSDATTHVCKDRCWFKTYEPVKDGSILYMGDDHFAPVHGRGSVVLEFSSGKSITLFNVLYVPKLRKNLISGPVLNKCGYKQVYESDKYILSKSGVFVGFGYYNNGLFMLNLNKILDDSDPVYMSSSTFVNSSLWHAHLGYVHYKRMLKMSKDDLIPVIDENTKKYRGGGYYDPVFFQSVGIIHETIAPYTPQQNGVAKRKNRALKEMVNSMLSYSGLSEGFWGESMLTACYLLNRVPNKSNETTSYELWYKKRLNLLFLRNSKAYRFYVIEPNDSVSINSIIDAKDTIFDENRFSSIHRPNDIIPNLDESQRDDHSNDVLSKILKPRKGKRVRKAKSYGSDFQLYLVEGSRDQKEAIDDEIGSIMESNTWVLSDLPPECKPLGCKWIFKRKMKVDGTIDKFKARLIIQCFRQKEGIDYFDTYTPVARITTIRLLLALAAIHNLVIHQMDVKTTFLNCDLDEEVYMEQPKGFVMPGNEHKVCKLVKSLYGLKQTPKQWHQKFDEVVLSSGFSLNQSDKCVYSKFDSSDKGVIICLYVDDMLIFGTEQNQVDKTKKFLSLRFSMKDMGEADVILDCSHVSTIHMDLEEKLKPNTGKPVNSLEYSRANWLFGVCYDKALDLKFLCSVRLSRFTSNPSNIIGNIQGSSSTSGWVFCWGCVPFIASKKQTCISGSTIESEFVALAAASKEAEWLRNLIHEIPIWPKPIAPISIRCDSAATLAKTYSQIYNGKSRHLGVRHSMIRELIRNGVISIKFVRSQYNLADHLTKGLARDLVIKSVIWMGLKSI